MWICCPEIVGKLGCVVVGVEGGGNLFVFGVDSVGLVLYNGFRRW